MSKEFEDQHIDVEPHEVLQIDLGVGATAMAGVLVDEKPKGQSAKFLDELHNENPEIEPRQYQADCLDALTRVRRQGNKRALVHMATGLGKTTVVATDVKRYTEAEKPGAKVLFLSHRNEIGDQARLRFEGIVGGGEDRFGTLNGVRKENMDAQFLFASIQTMQGRKEDYDPEEFDYVVVDEGHHGKAESYEPTIKYFKPKFLLGLTATPDRGDLQDIREIFGHEVYSKTLAQALKEGLLARPDYRVILDDVQEGALEGDDYVSVAELNRTVFIPKRDEEIVKIIGERIAEVDNPRVIIFCPSIEHTERIANLLPDARALHSKVGKQTKNIVAGFRDGTVPTLVTIDMFNEGVDIPEANVIVFLRATQSETIFLQQLGRGLRKLPGKEGVLVLDFVANCDRLLMIERLIANTDKPTKKTKSGDFDSGDDSLWDDPIDFDDFMPPDDDRKGGEVYIKDIGVGTFEFTETTRKIAEIIKRIQQRAANFESWGKEDSVKAFQELSGDNPLGKVALQHMLPTDINLPSFARFLEPFDGSMRTLQEAAGYEPLVDDWSEWTEEDSLRAYRELSGDAPLSQSGLYKLLQGRDDLPSYDILVRPFDNSIRELREAAGYKQIRLVWDDLDQAKAVAIYRGISGDAPLPYKKLKEQLAAADDLPIIDILLRPFNGNLSDLQDAAEYERTKVEVEWTREDTLRVYDELCEAEGKTIGQIRLHEILKERDDLPGMTVFLKGFNRRMRELQAASGRGVIHNDWSGWTADQSVSLMIELIGQGITSVEAAAKALTQRSDVPSMGVVLKPFGGKFKELMKNVQLDDGEN